LKECRYISITYEEVVVSLNRNILKTQWERRHQHVELSRSEIEALVSPFINEKIHQISFLSDGCINTNYKISFERHAPVVLRVYTRDKSKLIRERNLHQLVANKLPVPKFLFSETESQSFDYPYAITEFIEGELFRNVILSGNKEAISECSFSAGELINNLRQITFDYGGFFQDDLSVLPFNEDEKFLIFAFNCIESLSCESALGQRFTDELRNFVESNQEYFPKATEANLTHADFDPANMLVANKNGQWKITALLDWEFAFAGTYFLDMGMMLRYSHHLPEIYEQAFIAGVESKGFKLPKCWKKTAKLMDLINFLSMCYYNPKQERPKMFHDVVGLVQQTIANWEDF